MSIYLTDEEMDEQGQWHDKQRDVITESHPVHKAHAIYDPACRRCIDDHDQAEPEPKLTCCDGTGFTGNPCERCVEHYEVPGFGSAGLY